MMPDCLTRSSRSFERGGPGEWDHLDFHVHLACFVELDQSALSLYSVDTIRQHVV